MSKSPLSILIVEDEPDTAVLMTLALRRDSGFITHTVATLHDARRHLVSSKTDVVLLDLNLPESGGLHTLLAVRRVARDVTVVVVTGETGDELAVRALRAGADDYLRKGKFEVATLVPTIRHAYERHRIQAAFDASEKVRGAQDTTSFEQLVATISARLTTRAPHELNRSVQEALERIGDFFDVERVALFEVGQHHRGHGEANRWLAERNPGQGAWPTPREFPAFSAATAYLDCEGNFLASKDETPCRSLAAERHWLELTGSAAALVLRVARADSFRGLILLDSTWCPREWELVAVQRLRVLVELIASSILSQRGALEREPLLQQVQGYVPTVQ